MARLARDPRLETREARSRLPVQHEPYWRQITTGVFIGYRKGKLGGAWYARYLHNGGYIKKRLGKWECVACPAGGTLALTKRLDQAVGGLFSIVTKFSGPHGWGPIVLKKLLLAFLEQRTDPRVIPGLEAQIPGSPLIHLVNRTRQTNHDGLAAIAAGPTWTTERQ